MTKKKLFEEDSEEEVSIKTENEYAKKYDTWRGKEELHKLEQKYGSKSLDSDVSESDSEDESDEPLEATEVVDKQFLKTLALLKTKDPRIYDPNFKFFDEEIENEKEKQPETKKLTFEDSDDDDDNNDPNIFSIEKKAEFDHSDDVQRSMVTSKEDTLKDYLTGKIEHVDQEEESDLAPLRALWSDPKLNDGEAFLRDYILNKKYLEEGDIGDAAEQVRDDEDLEEDEKRVEEQGKFERAYNFRFEEPDDEFLKRFPRTMNYIRPKDDRRSRKRAEVRERKEEEKKKKLEEIARMKALKLKEIQEKIAKIKEVTGNEDLAFKEEDIEGDFDPEEHDKRMKALFDEQYYGDLDDQKPVFPELDEELEIENWENYEAEDNQLNEEIDNDGPHCEDDDFNMDADYDPKKAKENLLEELKRNMGKKRRNRKRKSKLAQLLAEDKPKFVPDLDKKYSEFMEEYYKMDCEDVIGGDLPTRFKYRQVVPNDYGLTVEEILLADDKELTQWVPIKKIVKYRPENIEKSDVKVYSQKAANVNLKKKVLPSLFKLLPEEPEVVIPAKDVNKKKKKNMNQTNTKGNDTNIHNKEDAEIEMDNPADIKEPENNFDNNKSIEIIENEHQEITTNDSEKNHKKKKKNRKIQNAKQADPIINNTNSLDEIVDPSSNVNKNKSHDYRNETTKNSETCYNNGDRNNIVPGKPGVTNKKKKKRKECSNNGYNNFDTNKKANKKQRNLFTVETVSNEGPTRCTNTTNINSTKLKDPIVYNNKEENTERQKKHPKKKSVNMMSSSEKPGTEESAIYKTNDLKRKFEPDTENSVPRKKRKDKINTHVKMNVHKNKKGFKHKSKTTKQDDKTENPLSSLSDERLKAYGLNPKKYRSFLKYKKF